MVNRIIKENYKLALSDDAVRRIQHCRDYLDKKMENQSTPIYGVTTGFGSLCDHNISKEDLSKLQKNLVMSHACGTGDLVPKDIIRIMLLLKVQSLSYGNSGVQVITVQRLIDFSTMMSCLSFMTKARLEHQETWHRLPTSCCHF